MVTLKFRRTQVLTSSSNRMLEMLLHNWILETCSSDSDVISIPNPGDNHLIYQFAYSEDAVVIKLKGAPASLQKYIEIC